jgi:hypothetical protein
VHIPYTTDISICILTIEITPTALRPLSGLLTVNPAIMADSSIVWLLKFWGKAISAAWWWYWGGWVLVWAGV